MDTKDIKAQTSEQILIEYLEWMEKDTVCKSVDVEVSYRGLTSQVMASNKRDDKLLAAQTQTGLMKKQMEIKLRKIRELLQEAREGTYIV